MADTHEASGLDPAVPVTGPGPAVRFGGGTSAGAVVLGEDARS
ncbi:hypothetical protein [Nocardia sp. CA-290969]